jgi:hypothetical protein
VVPIGLIQQPAGESACIRASRTAISQNAARATAQWSVVATSTSTSTGTGPNEARSRLTRLERRGIESRRPSSYGEARDPSAGAPMRMRGRCIGCVLFGGGGSGRHVRRGLEVADGDEAAAGRARCAACPGSCAAADAPTSVLGDHLADRKSSATVISGANYMI